MSFTIIPNELILDIAAHLPVDDLSRLARSSRTLKFVLSLPLLRRAKHRDLTRCILRKRPCSLRSILSTNMINIDHRIRSPGSNYPGWPMHHAALAGAHEMVAILIAHGAPIDEPESGDTPMRVSTLQCAVTSGCVKTVALILDAGANLNRASPRNKLSPLALACQSHKDAVANLLIDRGSELSGHVFVMAAYAASLTVLERLLDMGVPVDITYATSLAQQPLSALQYICMLCPPNVCATAEMLLTRGADVNRQNVGPGAFSPLYSAVRWNNEPLTQMLLQFGADRHRMYNGMSVDQIAVESGSSAVLRQQ